MDSKKEHHEVTVCISGGFDPIHDGHISLIAEAIKLIDRLVCISNNDGLLVGNKGEPF